MKLHFLPDIKFLSKFNKNSINGIKIVTIISTCCSKVKDS